VDLGNVLRRLAEMGAGALSPGEANVSVEADPVYTSPKLGSLLAMVANELLTNAVKHGAPPESGPAEIKITLRQEAGQVRLSIWNAGNPVPEDFAPSQQAGLGLRLAIGLVREQLGGTVTVRPHAGGTIAEVVLEESALGDNGANSPMGQ
jgi:two-component sensor histidine kinase